VTFPAQALEPLLCLCAESPLVVFDLETTGTDRLNDRIVEIAAIRFRKDAPLDVFERRVNPGIRIPRESTAVHGITDDDVHDLPPFAAIAAEVAAFFEGAALAGYNVRAFDVPVLAREFERAGAPFPLENRHIVDIQTIFFKKEPRDLAAAVRLFVGREHVAAHAALHDAVASAEVLAGQLRRYDDLPRSLGGLHDFSTPVEGRFVDPDKRFLWRDGEAVFNFSEHRGKTLAEVAEKNPGFLDWMVSRDFPAPAKQIVRDARRGIFPKKD
jgi:DNA polymerase-3 subunit epsilon